jgi:ribonuclease Z
MTLIKPIQVNVSTPEYKLIGGSVAGMGTNWTFPSLGVTFDAGFLTEETIACDTMVLSHRHMDHVANLMLWISQRGWKKMGKSKIICHPKMLGFVQKYLDFVTTIDGRNNEVVVHTVEHGQMYKLNGSLNLLAIKVTHRNSPEATAWVVVENRKKLKPEFVGMSQDELGKLARNGTQLSDITNVIQVAYTGDYLWDRYAETMFDLFSVKPPKVIITECTMTQPGVEKEAREGKHVHLNDAKEGFKRAITAGSHLVIGHFSQREPMSMIRGNIAKALGADGYTLAPVNTTTKV